MNHRQCRKALVRLVEEDLNELEARKVQSHLDSCQKCRAELATLRTMVTAASSLRPRVTVDDRLLDEARAQLHAALQRERDRVRWWDPIVERIALILYPPARLAFGATAMIAIGIVGGYFLFSPGTEKLTRGENAPLADRTRITNVRFTGGENGSGEVDFTFDALTPVHMHGNVDDPRIQKVLTYALLNEENPGVRLRAVSAVSQPHSDPADREVKAALVLALTTDKNPGVRREALFALRKYPFDDQIKEAMLRTLMSDTNPGLRVAAINVLDSLMTTGPQVDQNFINTLKAHSLQDDNNYVRLKARAFLQEVRQQ